MKTIQGFVTNATYISNVPGTINSILEMSKWSMTYSREFGEYQDASSEYLGYILHTAKTIDLDTGVKFTVPAERVRDAFDVVKSCIGYAQGHLLPYDLADFRNHVVAENNTSIANFQHGSFDVQGGIVVPEWVSWTSVLDPETTFKIWLCDASFASQYDGYEIYVVPPIDDLDSFFGNYTNKVAELAQIKIFQLMDRITEAKSNHPETYIRIMEFQYHNRNNPTIKNPTNWGVIIHGQAGDNIDSIKDAIAEYVLDNSTRPREEWMVIFPEIFRRTEFLFLPRWDQVSIPNMNSLAGLYKSMLAPNECLDFAQAQWSPTIPALWVVENTLSFPIDFKCLTVLALNGQDNIEGKQRLDELFPDYLPIASTELDFNRMAVYTREWMLQLHELIHVAETATPFTTIPVKFRRITRDGIFYVSMLYDNVNYMVAAKWNDFYQG